MCPAKGESQTLN